MVVKPCDKCGTALSPVLSCPDCGSKFEPKHLPERLDCPLCGMEMNVNFKCKKCGSEYEHEAVLIKHVPRPAHPEPPAPHPAAAPTRPAPRPTAPTTTIAPAPRSAPTRPSVAPPRPAPTTTIAPAPAPKPSQPKKELTKEESIQHLMALPGIGNLKAERIYAAGFTSLRKLEAAPLEKVADVRNIGMNSAKKIKAALQEHDIHELELLEMKDILVEEEVECPLCGTILSVYDSTCYECGVDLSTKGEMQASDADALIVYDIKLKDDPNDVDVLFAKASTLVKLGRENDAIDVYDKIGSIDASFEGLWHAKADAYTKMGEHGKAAECYKKATSSIMSDILGDKSGGAEGKAPGDIDDEER